MNDYELVDRQGCVPGDTYEALGGSWRIRVCGNDTEGAYTLLEQTSPPGAEVPCHRHAEEDETLFVLEGAAEISVKGETRRMGPRSVVYLPRGTTHGLKVAGDQPCRILHIITPAGLEHYIKEMNRLSPEQMKDRATVADLSAEYGIRFMP